MGTWTLVSFCAASFMGHGNWPKNYLRSVKREQDHKAPSGILHPAAPVSYFFACFSRAIKILRRGFPNFFRPKKIPREPKIRTNWGGWCREQCLFMMDWSLNDSRPSTDLIKISKKHMTKKRNRTLKIGQQTGAARGTLPCLCCPPFFACQRHLLFIANMSRFFRTPEKTGGGCLHSNPQKQWAAR